MCLLLLTKSYDPPDDEGPVQQQGVVEQVGADGGKVEDGVNEPRLLEGHLVVVVHHELVGGCPPGQQGHEQWHLETRGV